MTNTIILPPPNLKLLLVHGGEYRSLGLRRTNLLPSQPNRLNWLIAEKNTIPLSFSRYDVFSGKFQVAHFVLLRNVRLHRNYSTVQIYFIKSSGNSVPWYFNAKVSISSFRDSGCSRKSILFCNRFPRPTRLFFGFTCPSFLKFS